MRAYEVTRFGGPEVLSLSERADPLAEAGDVIVDVRAVGLNPIDILQRSGTFRLANPPRFPFVPGRFDKVFDLVGGVHIDALMTLVSAGGRLVSVASTPTPGSIRHDYAMSPLRAATLETALWVATFGKRRRARKRGFTYRFLSMRPSSEDLKQLSALIDSGDIEIMLDSTYDFEHAADAFARVETRRAKGKVVVAVGGTA